MKKLIASISVFALCAIIHPQHDKTTYQKKNLIGQVQELKEFEVSPIPPMQINSDQTIDTLTKAQFEFDKNHREIKNYVYIDGTLHYINEFVYNKTGQITERNSYSSGKLHSKKTYTYKRQRLYSEISYDEKENEIYKMRYEYNSKGKIIEMKYDNPKVPNESSPNGSVRYSYNEEKNEVEMKGYDGNSVTYSEISRYDNEGNRIEWIKKDYNGQQTSRYSYKYTSTENGKEIELISYSETNELRNTDLYKYDKNGDLTETITYRTDGSIEKTISYQYTHDPYGNWISQNITGLETSPHITIREITYWE